MGPLVRSVTLNQVRRRDLTILALVLGIGPGCLMSIDRSKIRDDDVSSDATPDGASPAPDAPAGDAIADAPTDVVDSPSAAYARSVLEDSPLSYYRFEETTGTAAKDEVGGRGGVYELGPALGAPGIAGGRSVSLGKNTKAHVRITTQAFRFPGNAPYTVEVWIKPAPADQAYRWIVTTEQTGEPRKG